MVQVISTWLDLLFNIALKQKKILNNFGVGYYLTFWFQTPMTICAIMDLS